MSFGYGNSGALGHGNTEDQPTPRLVETLRGEQVVQVSAGGDCSWVLLETGTALSFGVGHRCCLGHGDTEDQLAPKVVEALWGKRVLQVSAGQSHVLVLLEGGSVLSFGCDPDTIERPLVPKLQTGIVVEVAAGTSWDCALLGEDGEGYKSRPW